MKIGKKEDQKQWKMPRKKSKKKLMKEKKNKKKKKLINKDLQKKKILEMLKIQILVKRRIMYQKRMLNSKKKKNYKKMLNQMLMVIHQTLISFMKTYGLTNGLNQMQVKIKNRLFQMRLLMILMQIGLMKKKMINDIYFLKL